jgi:hypothetical protein
MICLPCGVGPEFVFSAFSLRRQHEAPLNTAKSGAALHFAGRGQTGRGAELNGRRSLQPTKPTRRCSRTSTSVFGCAGSCNTVATWPSERRVSSTVLPIWKFERVVMRRRLSLLTWRKYSRSKTFARFQLIYIQIFKLLFALCHWIGPVMFCGSDDDSKIRFCESTPRPAEDPNPFRRAGAKKQSFGELRYLVSSDRMAQSVIKQTNRSC